MEWTSDVDGEAEPREYGMAISAKLSGCHVVSFTRPLEPFASSMEFTQSTTNV